MFFSRPQWTTCSLPVVSVFLLVAGCSLARKDTHPPLPKLDSAKWSKLHAEPAAALGQAYQTAVQSPDNPEAVGKLAMTLHALGQDADARPVYQRAISLRPKNAELAYLYAHLITTGQGAGASLEDQIAAWEHAAAVNPDYPPARAGLLQVLLAAHRFDRARSVSDELLKTHSPEALSYYWAGKVRRQQGDLPAAIQFFLTACDLDPQLQPARVALAEAHRAAGDEEKASAQDQLVGKDAATAGSGAGPDARPAASPGSTAAKPPANPPTAGAPVAEAVRLELDGMADPLLDHLLQLRGPIAVEMENARRTRRAGRPQEAIRSYLAVLHRDSKHAEAYAGLMELAYQTGQFAAMKEHYQKATQAGIDLPSIQFAWAQALMAQNHTAEAEKLLRNAALREPKNATIQAQLAAAQDRMQHRSDAEISYRKVLELDPANRDARAGLARLVIGKNPGEAAALFEGSIGGPDTKENAIRLYQLSDAYFRLRKWDMVVARAQRGRQLAASAKVPWLVARLENLISRAQAQRS